MFNNRMTYGYNDISIQPARLSTIHHRSECNTLKNGKLPIFAAPMSTVVDERNFGIFEKNDIIPILPRNIDIATRHDYALLGKWVALSLEEFAKFIDKYDMFTLPVYILIDVANGNMEDIFTLSVKAKTKFGKDKIILMAGNIANPKTYYEYCKAGIDYVRVSVGSGFGCSTTTQTSIHYGIVNLLDEISIIKGEIESVLDGRWPTGMTNHMQNEYAQTYKCVTKVIADGGIRNYSDVAKALALGADYVMIGGMFSKLVESCAKTYYYDKKEELHIINPLDENINIRECGGIFVIESSDKKSPIDDGVYMIEKLHKVFYGMASKRGQEDLFGYKKKTAEGLVKHVDCTTNIDKWVENMKDFLASAMSYCNIQDVNDFNEKNVETYPMSPMLQNSINK